jgi:hypothetical protein
MTTILSVRAATALAERHVRAYGPVTEARVLHELDRYGVDPDRAERAVAFALVRGRIVRELRHGEPVLRRPRDWRAAA